MPGPFPSLSLSSSLSLSQSALGLHELTGLPLCLSISPKAGGPNNHGPKPQKLWAKTNLSSLSVDYIRYFVTVITTWLTLTLSGQMRKFTVLCFST
jgi:hypothetical protein